MSGDADAAARLASAVLPTADDLWGTAWSVDDDVDVDEGAAPGPFDPDEVPPGFPDDELLADDAVSLEHPGPVLVHAVSAVFTDRAAASRAWTLLGDPVFVERFLAGLAGDEAGEGEREVLGPVQSLPAFAADRAGWRAAEHHAAWSVADGEALLPISVDMAVLLADRVVVVVWLAGPAGDELEAGWRALLHRLELRCEAALAAG